MKKAKLKKRVAELEQNNQVLMRSNRAHQELAFANLRFKDLHIAAMNDIERLTAKLREGDEARAEVMKGIESVKNTVIEERANYHDVIKRKDADFQSYRHQMDVKLRDRDNEIAQLKSEIKRLQTVTVTGDQVVNSIRRSKGMKSQKS